MTVFANNLSHNKSIFSLTSFSPLPSIFTSIIFPIRSDFIPLAPSFTEADFVASPAGSKTEGLSLTKTLQQIGPIKN